LHAACLKRAGNVSKFFVAAWREGEEYFPKSSTSLPGRLQILFKEKPRWQRRIASGVGNATNALAVSVREDLCGRLIHRPPKKFLISSPKQLKELTRLTMMEMVKPVNGWEHGFSSV